MPKKSFTPKIVSANDLFDGDVVYLGSEGWTRTLSAALIAHDMDEADTLLARAAREPHRVVGPYLADVDPAPEGPRPLHFREAFRAVGPSFRPDLQRKSDRTGEPV